MFLRMVSMGVQANDSDRFAAAYEQNVIAALRRQSGCSFASLLQNIDDPRDCISVTIWESKSATEEYERSGLFKSLVESLRSFYEESNEFQLKLTDDLSIEYTPVQIDPTLKQFDDNDTQKAYIRKFNVTPYAAKIITLTVQQEKTQEFQDIFAEQIIPKFKDQKGFIHIILLRNGNEFHIISFWDAAVDLHAASGDQSLAELTRNIVKMLPSTVRWKVSHRSASNSTVSSEDLTASVYRVLTGEWFSA